MLITTLQFISATSPSQSDAAVAGWQVQIHTASRKETYATWSSSARLVKFASPGTTAFPSATAVSTGANTRTTFGAGEGVYSAFFNQTDITKIAFVDGSSSSLDPTAHTNYLIFDLIESTGGESLYAIIKRLDAYLATATSIHGNDTVFGNASVLNLTAGTNGYSGTLSSSGGTGFKTNSSVTPTKFALWGINRDSDNDSQVFAAYSGNLESGKSDAWRLDSPSETFWSFWGGDFHTGSRTQRIGNNYVQTTPGVPLNGTWTGNVYMLAFSQPQNAEIAQPTLSGPAFKGVNVTISATSTVAGVIRFFANGKRIANCKDRSTSGTSPNNVATCVWKPTVNGATAITATVTPSLQGVTGATSSPLNVWVTKRTTTR